MIPEHVRLTPGISEHSRDNLPLNLIGSELEPEALQPVMPSADSWDSTDVVYCKWRRPVDLLFEAHMLVQSKGRHVSDDPSNLHPIAYPREMCSILPLDLEQIVSMAFEGHEPAVSALRYHLDHWRIIAGTARVYRGLAYMRMWMLIGDTTLIEEMQATETDDSSQALLDWLLEELQRLHLFAFVMVLEAKECLKTAGDENSRQAFGQYLGHWQSRQRQILYNGRLLGSGLRKGAREKRNCRHVLDARYARVT